MNKLFHAVFLVVPAVLVSCADIKLPATGEEDEILVFTDDSTWQALELTVRDVFEDTVYTPQPEQWYRIRRVPFDRYQEFNTHANRIVLASLDGSGPVAEFMRRSLDPSVQALVERGEEFVFNKYDVKAQNQILMFLAGKNVAGLRSAIEARAPDLLYFFKSASLKRELTAVASEGKYHKKDIEQSLLKRYGWVMTIQHDYFVAKDSAEGRFFWVRRATPADMERWIFVYWRDVRDPRILTDKYVLRLRDSLTSVYFRTVGDETHVEVAPYYLQVENVNFLGRFAYEMRGNWRFSDKSGGGPFVNYTFYDEPSRRLYMLDGSIFAPRVEKKKLILQVDALLHTFRTMNELTAEEKEELGLNE